MIRNLALLLAASAPVVLAQTAETRVYRVVMSPANEVPPITGLQASGMGTVSVHVMRNAAGQIVSGSTGFQVDYVFPGPVSITGLHIHPGAAGTNGAVTINSGIVGASPLVSDTGRGSIGLQGQTTATDTAGLQTLSGIWNDPSGYYLNLHTTVNPGGAIRGQLMRADLVVVIGMMSPANEVPPITDLNASAVGSAIAIVTRDSRAVINSGEVIFDVNYTFPSQVMFTGLHIHSGAAGINAPVTLNSGLRPVASSESGRGNLRFRAEMDVTNAATAAALEGLFTNPTGHYINLHTSVHTGGAVRAQVRRTDAMRFQTRMTAANEVPSITDLDASATAEFTLHTIRAANGNIQAGVAIFDVNHRFPGEVEFTGLHVHDGIAVENGPVRLDSGVTGAAPIRSASGFGNVSATSTISTPEGIATMNSLVANPERHYINLHSTVHRGGAVRAQLGSARSSAPAVGAVISAVGEASLTNAAPGGLVSLYGGNIAAVSADLSGWMGTALPTSLNGVEVTIGGRAAPLLLVSDTQVNAQVPFETPATGPVQVTLRAGGLTSNAVAMPMVANAPGMFTYSGGAIVVKNADFSLVGFDNPASAGDILVAYVTGMGQTTPALATGALAPASPLANTGPVTVQVAGRDAEVIYSIASPGFVGLYQVAFRMPAGISPVSAPVVLRMGSNQSNSALIAVR